MITNGQGMVADYSPTSQFYPNETEFACGFYTSWLNAYAGRPGYGPSGSSDLVRKAAEAGYNSVYGSDGANMTGGISIPEMHTQLHNGGMHYYDIVAINANSQRANDVAAIKMALAAGYPVVATVTETSVRDLTGDIPVGSPYEWKPAGTHVLTWVGIAADGNLLAADPANVVGPLQGTNHTRAWPRKYDASVIDNQWASIVQLVGPDPAHPWLKQIPDPLNWPAGFNAQNFQAAGGNTQVTWMNASQAKQAEDYWHSTTQGDIPVGGNAPAPAGIFPTGQAPNYQTGIALAWQSEYQNSRFWGPPLSYEFKSVNWSGREIVAQIFAGGWVEWEGWALWHSWQKS